MNELALFAGVGGGLLGTHLLGWKPVAAVEKEPFCREVLLQRQRDGLLPLFPIWDDANTFDGRQWRGVVDIVSAGFPCQPFSVAGSQSAGDDDRNGWPSTLRIIGEVEPRYVLLENVTGLLAPSHGYFGHILGGLASLGYDVAWDCFPATAVGAPHRRDRLWILAVHPDADTRGRKLKREPKPTGKQSARRHKPDRLREARRRRNPPARVSDADSILVREQSERFPSGWHSGESGRREAEPVADGVEESVAGSEGQRIAEQACDVEHADDAGRREQRRAFTGDAEKPTAELAGWWKTEPAVGRVVDGMAHRVDQLRALGNGQVPALVPLVFYELRAKLCGRGSGYEQQVVGPYGPHWFF